MMVIIMAALCCAAAAYMFSHLLSCGFTHVTDEDDGDSEGLENLFLLPLSCVTQC